MSDGALMFLMIVILFFLFVAVLAMKYRTLFKMGMRNLTRRKVNTVIIVCGLMIGTAIISGSLIVGDTLENLFTKSVYDSYDETDETAYTFTPNGTYAFFNYSVYEGLNAYIETEDLDDVIEDVSPEISISVSVLDRRTKLSEAGLRLFGVDHSESETFGRFHPTTGGSVTTDDLEADQVYVNELVADELDVRSGDGLVIYYGVNSSAIMQVKAVVEFRGRAAYGMFQGAGGLNLFVRLDVLQDLLGVGDQINLLKISNVGDRHDGMKLTDEAADGLEPYFQDLPMPLILSRSKQDGIDTALEGSRSLTELFLILGAFSIIAGVMLVVNIFVMLAEERKGEMGIQRAIGLRAKYLMYTFLFEGAFLAVFAALIGVFIGVAVAYLIILAFSNIFIGSAFPIMDYFTFTGDSLVIAFSAGLMITFITIVYASWKVSKLNIIRAIRNIPEPRYKRHEIETLDPDLGFARRTVLTIKDQVLRQYELLIMALGAFMTYTSVIDAASPVYLEAWIAYAGLSVLLLGSTLLFRRWMLDERAFTLGGALILGVWSYPYGFFSLFGIELEESMVIWIFAGTFMVMGALFIVIYNNHLILGGLIRIFGRFRTIVPVFKTAISYPMDSKFRTGMTLAMFTLIIFTITTTAMIISQIEGNIDQITKEQSGGYHMIGFTNPNTPLYDVEGQMEMNDSLNMNDFSTIVPLSRSLSVTYAIPEEVPKEREDIAVQRNLTRPFPEFEENGSWYSVIGCTDLFFNSSDYELDEWDEKAYPDYGDAWKAVQDNGSLAIIDHSIVPEQFGPPMEGMDVVLGSVVVIRDPFNHTHVVTIIGITKQSMVQGVFVNSTVVREEFNVTASSLVLFKFRKGLSEGEQDMIAKTMESAFIANGMQTFIIKAELESQLSMIKNFFYLLEAFIGLGLVVGIAGLGIITIRSVTERRQQIGMLRAIGFRRNMILKSFLIESSFIALMGIVLGVGLGIILGYNIYLDFEAATFVIPWDTIFAVSGISYFFTFISTVGPARRAARVAPAEALRYLG